MKIEKEVYFALTPEWVLYANISPQAVRLYGVLDRHAGKKRRCTPSRRLLAEKMNKVSLRTVDRATDELVRIGALSIRRRKDAQGDWTSNEYMLHVLPKGASQLSLGSDTDVATRSDTGDTTGSDTDGEQNERKIERTTPLPPHSGGSKRDRNRNPRALGVSPRQVAEAETRSRREAQDNCEVCGGRTYFIDDDDETQPCPNCRPQEVVA